LSKAGETSTKSQKKSRALISFLIALLPLVLSYPIALFVSGLYPPPIAHTELSDVVLAIYQCTDSLRTTILTGFIAQAGIFLAAIYFASGKR
jgi:hypothetical protein